MSQENFNDEEQTDWWWVDYVEKEVDSELAQDMNLLLKVAPKNWDTVREIEVTKELVRSAEGTDLLLEGWDSKAKQNKPKHLLSAIKRLNRHIHTKWILHHSPQKS